MSEIRQKDRMNLCMKSGNRCAKCRVELATDQKNDEDPISRIGDIAHIKGNKPASARYDGSMDDVQRNGYSNLILLCKNCHTRIDDQPHEYTAEKLLRMKREHEDWVRDTLGREITQITFAELEEITKHLAGEGPDGEEDFDITHISDKIRKNHLSETVLHEIETGMTRVKLVEEYVDSHPDSSFGLRLKNGFVTEYIRLKDEEKLQGDYMFYSLWGFAAGGGGGGGTGDMSKASAGLAVLVYLFEKCEVFEK